MWPSPTERYKEMAIGMLAVWERRSQKRQFGKGRTKRATKTCDASKNWHEAGSPTLSPSILCFTLNVLAEGSYHSLIAEGWILNKTCRAVVDTWASVTIARLEIVAGQPERKQNQQYVLRMAPGETIPVL
jgi:hypothetical protein